MIPTLPEIAFDISVPMPSQPDELAHNGDFDSSDTAPFARVLQAVRAPQSAAPLAASGAQVRPELFEGETASLPERVDLPKLPQPGNVMPPVGTQLPVAPEGAVQSPSLSASGKTVAQSEQNAPEIAEEADKPALEVDEVSLPEAAAPMPVLPAALPAVAVLRAHAGAPPVLPVTAKPVISSAPTAIAAALSSLEVQLEHAAAPLPVAARGGVAATAERAVAEPPVNANPAAPTMVSAPAPALFAATPANTAPMPMPAPVQAPANLANAPNLDGSIEQIGAVRDLARSVRPEMQVRHAEFGAVNIRLDTSAPGDLRAVLTSRDPGFIPAVQSALAERAVVAAADTSSNTGNNSQGRGGDNPASQHSGQPAGQQANYGSSPGSGQAPYQPYSAQNLRDGRSGAQASPQGGSADRDSPQQDRGLFA